MKPSHVSRSRPYQEPPPSNPVADSELVDLLEWSAPKEVSTRFGRRELRTAEPTPEFWEVWSESKQALKDAGIQVTRDDDSGAFDVNWWRPIQEVKTVARQRSWIANPDLSKLPAWFWAHQKEDAAKMLREGSTIVANQMGVGKTLTCLAVAKIAGMHLVVVCPAGLKINWMREAARIGVEDVEFHSSSKIPAASAASPYVLAVDEAHWFQTMSAQRTKAMLALAENAAAVFPVTGTPIKNGRPINLFPLLRAVGHPLGSNRSHYERHFCGGRLETIKRRRNGVMEELKIWKADEAHNLPELREAVKPWMVRRKKADCLDLPPLTRVLRDVEPTEQDEADYQRAIQNFKADYQRRAAAGDVDADAEALAELTSIRKQASLAKVEDAILIADEVTENGGQIIIFTEFRETAFKLGKHFTCPVVVGGMDKTVVQEIVDAFQAGKITRFIATGRTGGTGLNLTAANTVLAVDRPMTPGEIEQWESRAHRGGVAWPVTSIWLRAFPICRALDRLLDSKQQNIDVVMDGRRETVASGKIGEIKAKELLSKLLEEEQ